MKKKILKAIICLSVCLMTSKLYAASSLSVSKTTVTVGSTFTVTANVSSVAAWGMNVSVSGPVTKVSGTTSSADTTEDAKNGSKTITSTYKATGTGTITVRFTGDTTTETGINSNISITKTLTAKAATVIPKPDPEPTTVVTKSSNAKLKTLKVNVEGLDPNFNKNTTSYTLSVGASISKLSMTIVPEHSRATYYITGNKNFINGDNTVRVIVTAEDRKTTKTYKIVVTKAEDTATSNAYLENLIVSNSSFVKKFNKNTLKYTLEDVNSDVKSLDIRAFPEDQKASVKITGNDELFTGENKITITVTAQDKKTTKTYTLTVNKKAGASSEEETDNYVNVYNENGIGNDSSFWNIYGEKIRANASIILLYLLALVEFLQVIYLYGKLKIADPDYDKILVHRKKVIEKIENKTDINKEEKIIKSDVEERPTRRNNNP